MTQPIRPAVSNPEPNDPGVDIDEAVVLLHAVREVHAAKGDIVGTRPVKDSPNQISVLVLSAILCEGAAVVV